jgi:hypothetical protein
VEVGIVTVDRRTWVCVFRAEETFGVARIPRRRDKHRRESDVRRGWGIALFKAL